MSLWFIRKQHSNKYRQKTHSISVGCAVVVFVPKCSSFLLAATDGFIPDVMQQVMRPIVDPKVFVLSVKKSFANLVALRR